MAISIISIRWRHQMETFSALLAICAGNSSVPGEFPTQRPVTRSFDVYFDLPRINGWVNNCKAGDLRRNRAHYDVTVMDHLFSNPNQIPRTREIFWYYHNLHCRPNKPSNSLTLYMYILHQIWFYVNNPKMKCWWITLIWQMSYVYTLFRHGLSKNQ